MISCFKVPLQCNYNLFNDVASLALQEFLEMKITLQQKKLFELINKSILRVRLYYL